MKLFNFFYSSKLSILLILIPLLLKADSHRCIDIENDSNYAMQIVSQSQDLSINHAISPRSHSKITVSSTGIPNPANLLLYGIANNATNQIITAVRSGASVNLPINGKRPLEWAIQLGHIKAIECLVQYGAIL